MNQVTGTRVRRVSFVGRSATRDHERPSEPARVLLWKSEGADASTATPPRLAETATHAKERRLSKLLGEMREEIDAMGSDGTPPAVRAHHERMYGKLHIQLVEMSDPAAARRLRADNDAATERNDDMSTELRKRAIGDDDAKPGHGLLTLQEIEDRQERMAPLLNDLHDDLRRMHRTPETAPHVIERHERAHAALAREYRGLDEQRGLREAAVAQSARDGEPVVLAKADQLRKSDRSLSAAEAFRQAMRDPAVLDQYFAESGTARPVAPTTRHGLAKAAGDSYAEHGASVEARAAVLEKSEHLSPTRAYAKAISEAGVLASAA